MPEHATGARPLRLNPPHGPAAGNHPGSGHGFSQRHVNTLRATASRTRGSRRDFPGHPAGKTPGDLSHPGPHGDRRTHTCTALPATLRNPPLPLRFRRKETRVRTQACLYKKRRRRISRTAWMGDNASPSLGSRQTTNFLHTLSQGTRRDPSGLGRWTPPEERPVPHPRQPDRQWKQMHGARLETQSDARDARGGRTGGRIPVGQSRPQSSCRFPGTSANTGRRTSESEARSLP